MKQCLIIILQHDGNIRRSVDIAVIELQTSNKASYWLVAVVPAISMSC